MGFFEISSYHIWKVDYMLYFPASQLIIISYVECGLERSKIYFHAQQSNDENHIVGSNFENRPVHHIGKDQDP